MKKVIVPSLVIVAGLVGFVAASLTKQPVSQAAGLPAEQVVCAVPKTTTATETPTGGSTAVTDTNTSTTTNTSTNTTTHQGDDHNVVTVHDVSVGDVLSNNDVKVLNDVLDVNNNTVNVDNVLNPITQVATDLL